jgi:hypothetical protein
VLKEKNLAITPKVRNNLKKMNITPVVTLELPDLDDEEDGIISDIVFAGSKAAKLEDYRSSSEFSPLNDVKPVDGKFVSKYQQELPLLPCEASFQYLSQLRYVLEEIDEVISSTPLHRNEVSRSGSTLNDELEYINQPCESEKESIYYSSFYSNDKDDSYRDTDEEASFPSITSRDKIISLRKRPYAFGSGSGDIAAINKHFENVTNSVNLHHTKIIDFPKADAIVPSAIETKSVGTNEVVFISKLDSIDISELSVSAVSIGPNSQVAAESKNKLSMQASLSYSTSPVIVDELEIKPCIDSYSFDQSIEEPLKNLVDPISQSAPSLESIFTNLQSNSTFSNSFEKESEENSLRENSFKSKINVSPSINSVDLNEKRMNCLLTYFNHFLLNFKLTEDTALKGMEAIDILNNNISKQEQVFWAIFQLYGISDGVIVKSIKTSQLSRALKDADLGIFNSSQLDLMMVKITSRPHSKDSVKSNFSSKKIFKKPPNPKSEHLMVGNVSGAAFSTYRELINKIGDQLFNLKMQKKMKDATRKGLPLNEGGQMQLQNQLEVIEQKFMDLLSSKGNEIYEYYLNESEICSSGIFYRSSFESYIKEELDVSHSKKINKELVRSVWDRNIEQTKQIYFYYASSVEIRRIGNGPSKVLLSFEDCKEMMADFHIVPQLLDGQSFTRIFRVCKLFEWKIAEKVYRADDSEGRTFSGEENFDLKNSVANFSLSFVGFVELLTRIACFNNKLGHLPQQSLENLLHLMDISGGKAKLLSKGSRKSVSIKNFTYALS